MTADADSPAEADTSLTTALNLGWQVAEIESRGAPRAGQERPLRADLPTLSDLRPWELTDIGVTTIEAGVHRLASTLAGAGLEAPSTTQLRDAFDNGDKDTLNNVVHSLHDELLRLLHAADFTLGEAYDLGRSLAYTTLKPEDAGSLRLQFAHFRLETLQGWLADLATVLPAHAARPVAISLDLWRRAIPDPEEVAERPSEPAESQAQESPASPKAAPLVPAAATMPEEVRRRLHRQGKLWRELLTGEKDGRDMLGPRNYIDAGLALLADTGSLVRESFHKRAVLWSAVGLVTVPLVIVVLLLAFNIPAAAKVTGSIVAVATALGISWSGARATLGKALAKAEQPLWQAELDTAIAEAIAVLPTDAAKRSVMFSFTQTGNATPTTKLATAPEVAAQRAPRGPNT